MKTFSKYSNSNLELLLSSRKQVSQDKSEFGLLKFSKMTNQNIRSLYSLVVIENFLFGMILIEDIFDAYCRSVFHPGGRQVDIKE